MNNWFYTHKEHGICLTFKALIECGVKEDTLYDASRKKYKSWTIIPHPEHGKLKLVVWSKLQDRYKEKIEKIIGNIHEYISKQPIRDLIELDFKAENYYRQALLEMNVDRLQEFTEKYTLAASYLNMLIKYQCDKPLLKQYLNIPFNELLKRTSEIIKSDNICLPSAKRKLEGKIKQYKEQGYDLLISKKFGNKQAAKRGKTENGYDPELAEKQESVIRFVASKPNNFDTAQITRYCNKFYELQSWPLLSESTVYNIIKKNGHLIMPGRRGKREYDSRIAMQAKRRRPEYPLQYLTLDGWTVELWFQENGKFTNRLVVVIVLDVMNNYPVGYAIGDRESTDLIRDANINAANHIYELFGDYYQPRQIQSDHYGIKNLTPYYQAMAHLYTPAAVGNAKSKVIEPYFKYLNKTYCQPKPNWSGFNINSKKANQPNREFQDKIKHSFPNRYGVIQQIEKFIYDERQLKIKEYLNKWALLPEYERPRLSEADRLMVFGKSTGYTNSITGTGLIVTIERQKLVYDSFDPAFRSLQHLTWKIKYNERDLSNILVISEDDKHRFILSTKPELPMAIHDMLPEHHEYLSQIKKYNNDRHDEIKKVYVDDDAVILKALTQTEFLPDDNDEGILKAMFITNGQQKESLQDAKGLRKKEIQQRRLIEKKKEEEFLKEIQERTDYLNSKIDISKYLDD